MHLRCVGFHADAYPTRDHYPFNLPVFRKTKRIAFDSPVTLLAGENGTGKSTLLEALAYACGIHIWRDVERRRFENNPFEDKLRDYISVEWVDGRVPGSFFGSSVFEDFVKALDEWAAADPGQLEYFGGKSLETQSHAQFIVATHSPILLACPGALIYSFDRASVKQVSYEETDHYRIYKGFMDDRHAYLSGL